MIIEKLFTFGFCTIIIILSYFEVKKFDKAITPFTMSAWPFLVIIIVNNFILDSFGFKYVSSAAQLVILVCLFLIWLTGFIMARLMPDISGSIATAPNYDNVFKEFAKFQTILIIIGWVTIILNFHRAYSLINQFGGIWFLGDQRYEKIMSEGGWISHFVEIGKICFLLLAFTFKHSRSKLLVVITLFALFISTALSFVKYHVIWLIIFVFLFYNVNKSLYRQFKNIGIIFFWDRRFFELMLDNYAEGFISIKRNPAC